jgi:hypothetical protein
VYRKDGSRKRSQYCEIQVLPINLRLASRNRIKLRDPPEDIITEKLVDLLEDRLYGKVFAELGWEGGRCPYYSNWKNRKTAEES